MRLRPLLAATLAAALLPACSGDPAPIPIEEYCARFTDFACSTADSCQCLSGAERTFCPAFVQADCQDGTEKDVKSGAKAWDAAAAGRCLADLEKIAGDCSFDEDEYPAACEAMLTGARAAGAACSGSDECLPGLECVDSACVALPTDGQACASGRCAQGLFCGADHLCHAPRGVGGGCEEGGSACQSALFCDDVTRTCQAPRGEGGACTQDEACGSARYCSRTSHTCKSYPAAGGDCADSSDRCAEGFYCADPARTCQARKPVGASCTLSQECTSGTCTSSACAAPNACTFL